MNFEIRAKGKHYARQISQPQKIIVGRDEQCDIYICDDPLISRQHALINFAVNEITVTDLKSQNGVFINGERSYKKTVRLDDEIRIGRTVFYILVPQDNKCGECKRKILSSEIHEGKTLRRDKQIYCKTCFKPDVPKISSYQYKKARKGKIIKKTETKQQPKCVAKVKRLRYVNKTPEIPKPQICIIPDKKLEKSKMPEKVVAEAQTPSSPKVIGKWRNALKEMTSGKSTITEILHQVKQEEKMFVGETIASLLFDQWLRKEVDVALNATQFKISVEEKALREVEEISWQDRYKIQKKL